jgi:DNA-binding Lrp family transcriptional regulator
VVLERIAGQTVAEVARSLGISRAAVYLRLRAVKANKIVQADVTREARTHSSPEARTAAWVMRWEAKYPGVRERLLAGEVVHLELSRITWASSIRGIRQLVGRDLTYRHMPGRTHVHALLRLRVLPTQ